MIKRVLLTAAFLVLGTALAAAQKHPVVLSRSGRTFLYNDSQIPISKIESYLFTSPEAMKHLKRSGACQTAGIVTAAVGAGLIIWPVGTLIGGGKPIWWLAAAGAGTIALVTLPLYAGGKSQVKKAVRAYNSSLGPDLSQGPPAYNLSFEVTPAGTGLVLTF